LQGDSPGKARQKNLKKNVNFRVDFNLTPPSRWWEVGKNTLLRNDWDLPQKEVLKKMFNLRLTQHRLPPKMRVASRTDKSKP
jgi:hypothetical protein